VVVGNAAGKFVTIDVSSFVKSSKRFMEKNRGVCVNTIESAESAENVNSQSQPADQARQEAQHVGSKTPQIGPSRSGGTTAFLWVLLGYVGLVVLLVVVAGGRLRTILNQASVGNENKVTQ
jgi:hypothetical protein